MAKRKLGEGLGELLKEIEELYARELPPLSRCNCEQREFQSEQFVKQSIDKLALYDRKFVQSFTNPLMKEAAIKTILHIKGEYQPRAKKTHSNEEVVRAIEKIEKDYPNFNVTEIINFVAEKLNMTPRAVRKHYYKK